jgi:hypothetical protein
MTLQVTKIEFRADRFVPTESIDDDSFHIYVELSDGTLWISTTDVINVYPLALSHEMMKELRDNMNSIRLRFIPSDNSGFMMYNDYSIHITTYHNIYMSHYSDNPRDIILENEPNMMVAAKLNYKLWLHRGEIMTDMLAIEEFDKPGDGERKIMFYNETIMATFKGESVRINNVVFYRAKFKREFNEERSEMVLCPKEGQVNPQIFNYWHNTFTLWCFRNTEKIRGRDPKAVILIDTQYRRCQLIIYVRKHKRFIIERFKDDIYAMFVPEINSTIIDNVEYISMREE